MQRYLWEVDGMGKVGHLYFSACCAPTSKFVSTPCMPLQDRFCIFNEALTPDANYPNGEAAAGGHQ